MDEAMMKLTNHFMGTKEDFMKYFNHRAFIVMNSVYGTGDNTEKASDAVCKVYHDSVEFLHKAYHNIAEFKNDKSADEFVYHVIKYLEAISNDILLNPNDTNKYEKILATIKNAAIEGGFIND